MGKCQDNQIGDLDNALHWQTTSKYLFVISAQRNQLKLALILHDEAFFAIKWKLSTCFWVMVSILAVAWSEDT